MNNSNNVVYGILHIPTNSLVHCYIHKDYINFCKDYSLNMLYNMNSKVYFYEFKNIVPENVIQFPVVSANKELLNKVINNDKLLIHTNFHPAERPSFLGELERQRFKNQFQLIELSNESNMISVETIFNNLRKGIFP